MSSKKRRTFSREFKTEGVRLITDKGYSIAEASGNLGIDYRAVRDVRGKRGTVGACRFFSSRGVLLAELWL